MRVASKFLDVFITRGIATTLLAAGVLGVGIMAYAGLPVSSVPQVEVPGISVSAGMPGASAQTMASSVTVPLERALSRIPGLVAVTSSSQPGSTLIDLEFDLDRDVDSVAMDVQAALSSAAADLPSQMPQPPTFEKSAPSDARLLTVALYSDTVPGTELGDLAEGYVATELSRVAGVGQIYFHGMRRPAVRVDVDLDRIARLGVTLEQVRRSIANATSNIPKGALDGAASNLMIETTDQLDDPAAYAALVVSFRDGQEVSLGDVAHIAWAAEDRHVAGWVNGHPAVTVELQKQPGHNVVATVDRVLAELPQISAGLPAGVRIVALGDRTGTVKSSIRSLQLDLLLSVAMVVLVIWTFLGDWRATFIPALTIPISVFATFAVMSGLGYTLNNVSLMAITVVIGFVVDDAVVVVENALRYIEAGRDGVSAAAEGTREIAFTIFSMTLSLVAVFIPLLLMGGLVGRLFREFAVTASVAVLVSGLVSLTLTPMLCAYLLAPRGTRSSAATVKAPQRAIAWVQSGYEKSLSIALRHPRTMLGVTIACVLLSVFIYLWIPKGFFPQQDNGMINGIVEGPLDMPHDALVASTRKLAERMREDPAVRNVYFYVEGNPTPNAGRLLMDLLPLQERSESVYEVMARLKKVAKGMEQDVSLHLQARQDVQLGMRVSKTQFQYTLRHPDIDVLRGWAPTFIHAIESLPQLRDVNSDMEPDAPQIRLVLDRQRMATLGVDVASVDNTLYDAFGQRQVARFEVRSNIYRVVMEADPEYRLDEHSLDSVYIDSEGGQPVPLRSFASLEDATAPLVINRDGQFPAVTVSFNLADSASIGDAVSAIEMKAKELRRPQGLTGMFQGTAQAFNASMSNQPLLICSALLVVYIVLGIFYESLVHPLTIISTLPSASVGGLGILALTGTELSLIAMIGLIVLIGIVKKNGIMMVDFALAAEREDGLTPQDAIRRAAVLRFRPILMTTLAALLGALPLAFGHGAGAELRRPLGICVLGGLMLSQLLTVYTTPVIYTYLSKFSRRAGTLSTGNGG
ncbi:acriflavin resistance protein [Xanthomonas bromi]|uniref:Acriflavin resistance protein n=1 Tax=Xanthomonas bromi TaxID=56449 RepID=A0A1C3NRC9_9XANT|nr:efflux RND transporter permease subunit [Xanthomonas bromi]PPV05189.1 acriflavine resistance protein B [Xanthomonas bromi]SBV52884.1 acriflavin resistance protein [Xanthomonas bromi]